MFFTFLNKNNVNCPDLSLLLKYTPEEVLFYYYNSKLIITLDTYRKLKLELESEEDDLAPGYQWIKLLDEEMGAQADIENIAENEYLDQTGPYYYPFSNTRFYISKKPLYQMQTLSADDFNTIMSLEYTTPMDRDLLAYNKARKSNKKPPKNKEELIKDINMCLSSLRDIEKLNKHLNYLNKLLEQRYAIVDSGEIWPHEPDILPEKPGRSETTAEKSSNLISFPSIKKRQQKKNANSNNDYNHQMKVYLLRYREYEKACDRYKAILENWEDFRSDFMERCYVDIEIAESRLKNARKNIKIYNSILTKSWIHPDYQDVKSLSIFRHYLETGRAEDLQDCMNLFEEEKHWDEIKASQERIENTIYYMQNSDHNVQLASDHIEKLLKKVSDRNDDIAPF